MQSKNILFLMMMAFLIYSCDSSPKVIQAKKTTKTTDLKDLNAAVDKEAPTKDGHEVVVIETLDAGRYTYGKVKENDDSFWIAIQKNELEIGGTYYFEDALLKKNFPSKEFDRVFETLYLVSKIWKKSSPKSSEAHAQHAVKNARITGKEKIVPAAGAITIKKLISNAAQYSGKTVTITGKCVKFNPMIMKRNWLQIQDSSADNADLVVTTTENVQVGTVVTLVGTIALDKDFGAGYKYDIIMEGATLK